MWNPSNPCMHGQRTLNDNDDDDDDDPKSKRPCNLKRDVCHISGTFTGRAVTIDTLLCPCSMFR